MICYKDMTFCSFYKECKNGIGCPRALTPRIIEDAKKWWNSEDSEPPICVFVDKPDCFEKKENE